MTVSFVIIVMIALGGVRKKPYLCMQIQKSNKTMNSKILKLDPPYKVIYAGGKIGWHIATMITWADDSEDDGYIMESHSYPIIDQGEEYPAGTLVNWAELEDCRVVCSYNPANGITGTNIYWFAGIVEYDFQQLEPAGAEYMLERLKRLGCQIKLPEVELKDDDGQPVLDENGKKEMITKYDYEATLYISLTKGNFEKDPSKREYIVKSPSHQALYFESSGSADEIYSDLSYPLSVYSHYLLGGIGCVTFETNDSMLADVLNRLNAKQGIETNYRDLF